MVVVSRIDAGHASPHSRQNDSTQFRTPVGGRTTIDTGAALWLGIQTLRPNTRGWHREPAFSEARFQPRPQFSDWSVRRQFRTVLVDRKAAGSGRADFRPSKPPFRRPGNGIF